MPPDDDTTQHEERDTEEYDLQHEIDKISREFWRIDCTPSIWSNDADWKRPTWPEIPNSLPERGLLDITRIWMTDDISDSRVWIYHISKQAAIYYAETNLGEAGWKFAGLSNVYTGLAIWDANYINWKKSLKLIPSTEKEMQQWQLKTPTKE